MTGPQETAADWLERYGEDIDCQALREVAAREVVDRERARIATLRMIEDYVGLLKSQRREVEDFLDRPVRGEAATMRTLLAAAAKGRAMQRRRLRARTLVAILEHPLPGPIPLPLHAIARLADPIDLLEMMILVQNRTQRRFQQLLLESRARCGPKQWLAKTRAGDPALASAASRVAHWVQARHQDARGKKDRSISWVDVATCLQWHGNDLSHIGGSKPDALRQLVKRRRKKLVQSKRPVGC